MKLRKSKTAKGFTLIELITVVAIIMILAFILVPNVIGYINKSKIAVVKDDAKTVLNIIREAKAASDTPDDISSYDDAVDASKGGDPNLSTSSLPNRNLKLLNESDLEGLVNNTSLDWDTYKTYYGSN